MGRMIVVGVDGSPSSTAALQWAIEEARVRDVPLEVLHAWQLPPLAAFPTAAPVVEPEVIEEAAHSFLADVLSLQDTTGVQIAPAAVPSEPAVALIERSKGADLVVVGSHGRGGFAGLLLGSVSQQVVHHAHCPVVVVREPS